MRAPPLLLPMPGTSGSSSSAAPMSEEAPLVAGEVDGALDDDQREHEGDDRRRRSTSSAVPRELVVEPGDHHVADAVQQRGERQQRAVGAAGQDPHGEVGDAISSQHEREERHEPGGITALAPSEASV